MYSLLEKRELQGTDAHWIYKASTGLHFLQRMKLERKLCVHNGCVNTICWNEKGTLILSGSDDQHLAITDPFSGKNIVKLRSGHRSNIFSAKFMPSSMDKEIVSCSGSGEIFYTDVEREDTYGTNRFDCHFGSAYKLLVIPNEAATFLSCGDDGTVRFFDLRTKTSCSKFSCEEDILIRLRNAVTAMAADPVIPFQLAVASSEGIIRLYDRRMLKPRDARAMNESLIFKFPPPMASLGQEESGSSNGGRQRYYRVTSLNYRPGSHDLLVNYSSENIYLFNTRDIQHQISFSAAQATAQQNLAGGSLNVTTENLAASTSSEGACGSTSAGKTDAPSSSKDHATAAATPSLDCDSDSDSSPFKPIKRLRLRGDWSDTGPDARPDTEDQAPGLSNNILQRMSDLLTHMLNNRVQQGQADQEDEGEEARGEQRGVDQDAAPETPQEQHSLLAQGSAARAEASALLRSVIYGAPRSRPTGSATEEREASRTSISSEGMLSPDLSPQDMEMPACPTTSENDSERLVELPVAGPTDPLTADDQPPPVSASDSSEHLPLEQELKSEPDKTDLGALGEKKSNSSDELDRCHFKSDCPAQIEPVVEKEVKVTKVTCVEEGQSTNAGFSQSEATGRYCNTFSKPSESTERYLFCDDVLNETQLFPESAESHSSYSGENNSQTLISVEGKNRESHADSKPVAEQSDCPQVDEEARVELKISPLKASEGVCEGTDLGAESSEPTSSECRSSCESKITLSDQTSACSLEAASQIVTGQQASVREGRGTKDLTQGCVSNSDSVVSSLGSSSVSSDSFVMASLWSTSSATPVAVAEDLPSSCERSDSQQTLRGLSSSMLSVASSLSETRRASGMAQKQPGMSCCCDTQGRQAVLPSGDERVSHNIPSSFISGQCACGETTRESMERQQKSKGSVHDLSTLRDMEIQHKNLPSSVPKAADGKAMAAETSDLQRQQAEITSGSTSEDTTQGGSSPSPSTDYHLNISSLPHKLCQSCVQGKGKGKGKCNSKAKPPETDPPSSSQSPQFTPYNSGKMQMADDALCGGSREPGTSETATASGVSGSGGHVGFRSGPRAESAGSERHRRLGHSLPPTGKFQLYGSDSDGDDDADRDDDDDDEAAEHLPGRANSKPDKARMSQAAKKIQEMFRLKREAREMARIMEAPRPKVFMKYSGHRNCRTMIKEANFYGDSFVMSGSDCGRIFFWDRETGQLVMYLDADKHVVNCVQPNPYTPILASSGIDYDIKIWYPSEQDCQFDTEKAEEIVQRNRRMLEMTRDTVTVPAAFMMRILASVSRLSSGRGRGRQSQQASDSPPS